nr:hypothetical protein asmbl_2 [uncultured bacterium]
MISSGIRPSLTSSSCSRPVWWALAKRATHCAAVANAVRCPAARSADAFAAATSSAAQDPFTSRSRCDS